ncbi:MAG: hypothetical protein J7L11_00995 [Thermoprotei archaeon]|nr:hypothetical protein [Thermoprotei archaeon]
MKEVPTGSMLKVEWILSLAKLPRRGDHIEDAVITRCSQAEKRALRVLKDSREWQ